MESKEHNSRLLGSQGVLAMMYVDHRYEEQRKVAGIQSKYDKINYILIFQVTWKVKKKIAGCLPDS